MSLSLFRNDRRSNTTSATIWVAFDAWGKQAIQNGLAARGKPGYLPLPHSPRDGADHELNNGRSDLGVHPARGGEELPPPGSRDPSDRRAVSAAHPSRARPEADPGGATEDADVADRHCQN